MRAFGWLLAVALILGSCRQADNKQQAVEQWLKKGEAKLQARDYAAAAEAFHRYVQERGNLTAALPRVYQVYMQYRAIQPAYEFLIQYEPRADEIKVTIDRSDYYRVLGDLAHRVEKFEDALRWYEKAVQIDDHNHLALNNYAYSLAEQGKDLERALKLVNRALFIRPNLGTYYDTRGWIYYKMGRYEEALRDLRLAVDTVPNHAEVRYHLAAVYVKLGRKQDAQVELEKALALDPQHKPSLQLQRELQGAKP
ncbi:MAG: tetratricopeptide repeat protein [Armatimonadota bacterium]